MGAVEHIHKPLRVDLRKEVGPRVQAHHLRKICRLQVDELTGVHDAELTVVTPSSPENSFAGPLLDSRRGIEQRPIALLILLRAALQEKYLSGLLAFAEDRLLVGVVLEPQGTAEALHHGLHVAVDVQEEGMRREEGRVQRMSQLVAELLGKCAEDLDATGLNHGALLLRLVLQKLEDAIGKVLRHQALPEIPSQKPKLLHLIPLHVTQSACSRRDVTNDGGEGHHSEEEDDDRKNALAHVACTDLHGGRRELRHAPVQRCGVLVKQRRILKFGLLDPRSLSGLFTQPADEEPEACDNVVQNAD
mmetsp:Transcript_47761/g.103976  ORF Transcript_47761/g.103976 Transcript_47761/m.103976 type:complete len:304 (+) Transcript_47761:248-1159(+)